MGVTMVDRLLTLRELQHRLNVTRQTLWKWRQAGLLPVVYVGPFQRPRVERAVADRLEREVGPLDDVNSRQLPSLPVHNP